MDNEIKVKTDKNDKNPFSETKMVEEKGNGDTTKTPINLKEIIKEILANLEYKIKRKLTKKERSLLTFIAVYNYYKKGVTKTMLQNEVGLTVDYAEKWIFNLRNNGLLISSKIRKGHMMTYFLSNMQNYIPSEKIKISSKHNRYSDYGDIEENILTILFQYLSNNSGVFHNFRLLTKLKDKSHYEFLKTSNNDMWSLQSDKNKVKVLNFRLSIHRTIDIQVAPNGTIEIYIRASKDPYDLHHDLGLSEFFVDLGKIIEILETELRSSMVLENFHDWYIVRVEYNYDIEGLDIKYLSTGTSILQVKHLSHLYQFYTKRLPNKGLVLRLEKHFSFTKPYKNLKEFLNQYRDIEST